MSEKDEKQFEVAVHRLLLQREESQQDFQTAVTVATKPLNDVIKARNIQTQISTALINLLQNKVASQEVEIKNLVQTITNLKLSKPEKATTEKLAK